IEERECVGGPEEIAHHDLSELEAESVRIHDAQAEGALAERLAAPEPFHANPVAALGKKEEDESQGLPPRRHKEIEEFSDSPEEENEDPERRKVDQPRKKADGRTRKGQ